MGGTRQWGPEVRQAPPEHTSEVTATTMSLHRANFTHHSVHKSVFEILGRVKICKANI